MRCTEDHRLHTARRFERYQTRAMSTPLPCVRDPCCVLATTSEDENAEKNAERARQAKSSQRVDFEPNVHGSHRTRYAGGRHANWSMTISPATSQVGRRRKYLDTH
jgi:hypothetical protein